MKISELKRSKPRHDERCVATPRLVPVSVMIPVAETGDLANAGIAG